MKKNPDGTIDTKVKSDNRLNMSQPPIGDFLEWDEGLPITHLRIRSQYDWMRFAIFMKARYVFPGNIPKMDGKRNPPAQRKKIKKALAKAKIWIQKKAKDGPLKMFLMTPDPHGSGGSR